MSWNEDRVRLLEKQVRRQRGCNVVLGLTVLVGVMMAARTSREIPDVIQAKKIEVVNEQGKVAISLGSLQNSISKENLGSGMLKVMNANGLPAATIACGLSGGWLTVNKTASGSRYFQAGMSVAENDHGGTWLGGFFIRNGNVSRNDVVRLTMTPEGNGVLKTFDSEGRTTSAVP